MITIDGSQGEGGGQVLRTSLTLALVTGTPLRIDKIRAGRDKPGLLRQHLTAVGAAAEISGATVVGATLGSQTLELRPSAVRGGTYTFRIGTAGSATLVLQTILPALWSASVPSRIVIEGGTHNMLAPPFDYLERVYLPLARRMGARARATLERHGFYPAGGGRIVVDIEPSTLVPLELLERGRVRAHTATAIFANLPFDVARRELAACKSALGWQECDLKPREVQAQGPGNALLIEIESEHVTEMFCAFGEKGLSSEHVAQQAIDEARAYLEADVPIGPHLADQLALLLGLARGGSFRTQAPTLHTMTQVGVLRAFGIALRIAQEDEQRWRVGVG